MVEPGVEILSLDAIETNTVRRDRIEKWRRVGSVGPTPKINPVLQIRGILQLEDRARFPGNTQRERTRNRDCRGEHAKDRP